MRRLHAMFLYGLTLTATVCSEEIPEAHRYWPQWRGPLSSGVAPHALPPAAWNESQNIRWKVEIPGKGHSSPIVWGDLVLLTTAVPTPAANDPAKIEAQLQAIEGWQRKHWQPATHAVRFEVLAIDRHTGKSAWRTAVHEQIPHSGTHRGGSWASPSPVTDGDCVIASFGSYGLYGLDMKGRLAWKKDLGQMKPRNNFGEGISPVLHRDLVVVNWDDEGDSFITALDRKTGAERWRVERDEISSWATPLVVEHVDSYQVIVSATRRITAYDLYTGKTAWKCGGMTTNVVASPTYADGIVYAMSGFRGSALLALKLDNAAGDVTGDNTALLWKYGANTPYVPSPVAYGKYLYFLKGNKGELSCFDRMTGKPHYEAQKLEGLKQVLSSPIGAGLKLYVTDQDGTTAVVKLGDTFEVLGTCRLEDNVTASPAVVDRDLCLRGHKYLYCVGE